MGLGVMHVTMKQGLKTTRLPMKWGPRLGSNSRADLICLESFWAPSSDLYGSGLSSARCLDPAQSLGSQAAATLPGSQR